MPDARSAFFKKTDATMEVRGKAGRERPCSCGRVFLKAGDVECSSCKIERAAANLRALGLDGDTRDDDMMDADLSDEEAEYLRIEREGIQMEGDDGR